MRYFSVANNTKAVASVQGTNYSNLDFFKKTVFPARHYIPIAAWLGSFWSQATPVGKVVNAEL